jgi:hypothetical protein
MNRRSFISIITSALAAQRAVLGLGVAKVAPMRAPIAPPSAPVAPEFIDVPYEYSYSTILGPHETLRDDFIFIRADADFLMQGIAIGRCSAPFLFRLADSEGRYLSHSLINSDYLAGVPFPLVPSLKFPAAGRIGIDVTETSGVENGIEIRFQGVKRYTYPPLSEMPAHMVEMGLGQKPWPGGIQRKSSRPQAAQGGDL